MRTLYFVLTVTLTALVSANTVAQTPDGETPAVEAVCDQLIGATPGLYGLCVAYCEAHDAHLISPDADPAELDVPNREILENYNRRKTDADPQMPCVQQESAGDGCPCWTADQLLTVLPPSTNIDLLVPHACLDTATMALLQNLEGGLNTAPGIQLSAGNDPTEGFCAVRNFDYPGGPPEVDLPITQEEFQSCRALLADHANANSFAN
jgi:hypothetical protein